MKSSIIKLLKQNKAFFLFIILMCVFRSAVADWNVVPTGSMKPTILEGDRIIVNKLAYDVQLPFTHYSMLKLADPARGDIIVFESKAADSRLVKRVVGVPGDKIRMQNNRLYINDHELAYETLSSNFSSMDKVEDLLGVSHSIRINKINSGRANFEEIEVPLGYYLALGDNRDNSSDSRVIGFIPRDEIIGRSKSVLMSLNYDNYYLPRTKRFFHTL